MKFVLRSFVKGTEGAEGGFLHPRRGRPQEGGVTTNAGPYPDDKLPGSAAILSAPTSHPEVGQFEFPFFLASSTGSHSNLPRDLAVEATRCSISFLASSASRGDTTRLD